jgi:hypothetical protein
LILKERGTIFCWFRSTHLSPVRNRIWSSPTPRYMLNLSFNLAKPTVARVKALILNFDLPGLDYSPLVPYCLMQPLTKLSCLFTFFCIFFGGLCWPLLCLCRPFCICERCLHSNPESCRSKQARYQLSLPSPLLSHPSPST